MSGYCKRPECSEVSTVFKRKEAEGNDHEQDGFFVNVPSEEKGGVAAEGDC